MKRGGPSGHSLEVDYLVAGPLAGAPPEQSRPSSAALVYEQHADFVYRSLQHLGVRGADLDDLLQEVFVVVHRRLHTFSGKSKLTTWLFGICFRAVSRHRRRAYFRWERQIEEVPEPACEVTPEDRLSESRGRALLERALSRLSLERRVVFVLFELEGQSCQEIAALLDVPVGTVHSRLHTARKEITRALAKLNSGR